MNARTSLTVCPLCGSSDIEHLVGDHVSALRGTARNVPQTVCHACGEVFFGADSLEVIRSQAQRPPRKRQPRPRNAKKFVPA